MISVRWEICCNRFGDELASADSCAVEDETVRILVAEDHAIARVGVITIVNKQPDMTVVAAASNGMQAVKLYRHHLPDVTLLDMRMPILSGIDAASTIRDEFPNARMIALTTYGGAEDIRRALKAGIG